MPAACRSGHAAGYHSPQPQQIATMKQILNTITLACLVFPLTACGDATTDAELPNGTAPNDKREQQPESTEPDTRDQEAGDASGESANDRDAEAPKDPPREADGADDQVTEEGEVGDEGQPADRTTVGRVSFVLPEGWRVGEGGQFREFTLFPSNDFDGAEVAVGRFNGNVGGFGPNVARWARQAGVTLQAMPKEADYEQVGIDGTDATIVPLINDDAPNAIYAFWVPRGEDRDRPVETWTFKLTGSPAQVKTLRAAINGWAESVRFAPAQ